MQNFAKKQKYLNLGQKLADLYIFGPKFENNIVIFEISTLEFVKLQNFPQNKNALFGYFWARILENYCHI